MSRVLPRPDVAVLAAAPPAGARLAGRAIHPWAWWVWAIGAAVAVSMSTNPLLLVLLIAAVTVVVLQRRTDAPWARALWLYFALAGFIIVVRLVFQILIGGLREGRVLFRLPEIALPAWAAGIRLGGPVTIEGLVYAGVDAARLGGLLICIGAANALANPKTALRNVPAAFYQIATALVIAISVAPQLVASVLRVRRARRLRGGRQKGIRGVVAIIVPVLEDAIDRSLSLAAGMESRGYGRTRGGRQLDWRLGALLAASMVVVIFASFALLALPAARSWVVPVLLVGLAGGAFALHLAGSQLAVSRYRPDPWAGPEFLLAACGLATAAITVWLVNTDQAMIFGGYPMTLPQFSWPMLLAAALTALPAIATPPPPRDAA